MMQSPPARAEILAREAIEVSLSYWLYASKRDPYEQKYHEQILKHLQHKAYALGLELVPIE